MNGSRPSRAAGSLTESDRRRVGRPRGECADLVPARGLVRAYGAGCALGIATALPDALQVPFPITNAALLGMFVDESFGWPKDISVHSGHFAAAARSAAGSTTASLRSAGSPPRTPARRRWCGSGTGRSACPSTSTSSTRTRTLSWPVRSVCGCSTPPNWTFRSMRSPPAPATARVLSSARWVVANSRIPTASYDIRRRHGPPRPALRSPRTQHRDAHARRVPQ